MLVSLEQQLGVVGVEEGNACECVAAKDACPCLNLIDNVNWCKWLSRQIEYLLLLEVVREHVIKHQQNVWPRTLFDLLLDQLKGRTK